MSDNKLSYILNRIFHIMLFVSLGAVFLSIFVLSWCGDGLAFTSSNRVEVFTAFAIITFIAVTGCCFLYRKRDFRLKPAFALTERKIKIIIFSVIGAMLVLQLVIGYQLRINPIHDLAYIQKYSMDFAENGNFDLIKEDYANGVVHLIKYPNNFTITILLSFLYRASYLTIGYVPRFLPVALNCLAINASVLLTTLTAKKIFGNRQCLCVLTLCLLFAPYYTYTAVYYTDTLSMPFLIGAIYLLACVTKLESKGKIYALLAVAGAVVYLGYKLKASVVFVLICAIICMILKFSIKKAFCCILAMIIGFSAVGASYAAGFNSLNIVSEEMSYETQYPYTHWVMMGLKNPGGFNRKDSKYTQSFKNKDEKTKANLEEIEKRISDYGFIGLVKHTITKAVWTWKDGTYYISHHIYEYVKKSALHSYVLEDGENYLSFYAYSCGFQLFIILMMLVSVLKGIRKPRVDVTLLLKGLVFAIFIFLIIWEARSRYLLNMTPAFMLLAADGLKCTAEFLCNRVKSWFAKKLVVKHAEKATNQQGIPQ